MRFGIGGEPGRGQRASIFYKRPRSTEDIEEQREAAEVFHDFTVGRVLRHRREGVSRCRSSAESGAGRQRPGFIMVVA